MSQWQKLPFSNFLLCLHEQALVLLVQPKIKYDKAWTYKFTVKTNRENQIAIYFENVYVCLFSENHTKLSY